MISRRLRIRGTVQGVYYRESMRQRADELNVTGWVRNRTEGTVEAILQGEAGNVERLTAWARRGKRERLTDWARRGPPAAQVEGVDVEAAEDEPRHSVFEKRPTT
jgi:acylphosphatase